MRPIHHHSKPQAPLPPPKKKKKLSAYLEYRNVDRAVEVALYYGFTPLSAPLSVSKLDKEIAKELCDDELKPKECFCPAQAFFEEKVSLERYYIEKKLCDGPQPVLLCAEVASLGPKSKEKRLFLDILGSPKSITEAVLIQTVIAILRSEGEKELTVGINSIGDKDSSAKFLRELGNYYRKNISVLPASCRGMIRKNPLDLLNCIHEKCAALALEAPKPVSFLSESSRAHFKEVLEYLEELGVTYEIDHRLIANRSLASETIFEIRDPEDKENPLCSGFRYNYLGKKLGAKRDIQSVGAVIRLKREADKDHTSVKLKRPQIFFLQLGFDAKLRSLKVIELLRQAEIPVYQALAREKLGAQLANAESLHIPFTIIMGQKEALDNSVIVRNFATRAQETVKIDDLPAYLKKLKFKQES